MAQLGIVKISYNGMRRSIRYTFGNNYNGILETIMERFKIPVQRKSSLQLTNMNGKVFSKCQLYNYLLLHPNPETSFCLRHKGNDSSTNEHSKSTTTTTPSLDGYSSPTSLKRQRDVTDDNDVTRNSDNDDASYPATPVFRMNCFIGVYPSKCSAPPAKRVRFSEAANTIRIIPARSNLNMPKRRKNGVLKRTKSLHGIYSRKQNTKGLSDVTNTTSTIGANSTTRQSPTWPLKASKSLFSAAPQTQFSSHFRRSVKSALINNVQWSYAEQ